MSIFRVEKNKNYTVMGNHHLQNRELSLKAKGLLSLMLSLPESWDYSMNGLVAISKENITAIRNTLQELEKFNYLKRKRYHNSSGQIQYEYHIFEQPYIENMHTVKTDAENDIQSITNETNTNKEIDKGDKTKSSFFIEEEHHVLTQELINRKYINIDDLQVFYYDNLFETLISEGNTYKDLIQIIHYIIPRVIDRDFKDEDGNIIRNKYGYFKESILSNIRKLNIDLEEIWNYDEYFE